MIQDELRGKSGRGFALDFQNGFAIAQVFNYALAGQPSFHMGSVATDKTPIAIPLDRYTGGRFWVALRSRQSTWTVRGPCDWPL